MTPADHLDSLRQHIADGDADAFLTTLNELADTGAEGDVSPCGCYVRTPRGRWDLTPEYRTRLRRQLRDGVSPESDWLEGEPRTLANGEWGCTIRSASTDRIVGRTVMVRAQGGRSWLRRIGRVEKSYQRSDGTLDVVCRFEEDS